MRNLSIDTLTRILSNDKLQLNTEDQLLKFVNKCYKSDSKYSILYETVLFEIVSSEVIKEFTLIFDNEDMNHETWLHLINWERIESKQTIQAEPGKSSGREEAGNWIFTARSEHFQRDFELSSNTIKQPNWKQSQFLYFVNWK